MLFYADNLEYNKVNNTISINNVKIDNQDENFLIVDNAKYLKNDQLFVTKGNVKIEDTINKYLILTNKATYYKSSEKIITEGDTEADISLHVPPQKMLPTYIMKKL